MTLLSWLAGARKWSNVLHTLHAASHVGSESLAPALEVMEWTMAHDGNVTYSLRSASCGNRARSCTWSASGAKSWGRGADGRWADIACVWLSRDVRFLLVGDFRQLLWRGHCAIDAGPCEWVEAYRYSHSVCLKKGCICSKLQVLWSLCGA